MSSEDPVDIRAQRDAFVRGVEAALNTITPTPGEHRGCYRVWIEKLDAWARLDPTTSAFDYPPDFDPDEPKNPRRQR